MEKDQNRNEQVFMKQRTTHFFVAMTLVLISACAEKKTGSTVNQYITNPVTGGGGTGTGGGGTGTGGGTGAITGCADGVARSGATRCYYNNLPTLVFSGPGTVGPVYWSSANDLPAHISPNQFKTDASFAVRMKPSTVSGGTSIQGRNCSSWTQNNFNKLQVQVMLRRAGDGLGEVKTLTGAVGSASNTARFTVPGGTTSPYILEVISVLSNHSCDQAKYGKLATPCTSTTFYPIPVNGTSYPTECVAFNLEVATDDTYDLPN